MTHTADAKKPTGTLPPPTEYFNELRRVSKNQIVWGANYFISRMPWDSRCWLLWDKKFSDKLTFSQFEMAYTSFNIGTKKFDKNPTTRQKKFHPTQKPLVLYELIYGI